MKKYAWLLGLLAALFAGCSPTPPATPGGQIGDAEVRLQGEVNTTMDGALNAFSDLAPASIAVQASTEARPTLLAYNGEERVLIGGPWRPPFPWPIKVGIEDLVGKPLFLAARKVPGAGSMEAYLGILRRSPQGPGYEVEWYGQRGTQPIRTPVVVQQNGQPGSPTGTERFIVKFSLNKKEVDIIIIFGKDNGTSPVALRLVTSEPPRELRGRPIEDKTNVDGFLATFRQVCCGRPKPFPPIEKPWPILMRNDLTMVVVPYDNPRLTAPKTVDELQDADAALLYMRKRPTLPGGSTDCGPNGVWCPPDLNPFYNLRLRVIPSSTPMQRIALLKLAQEPREEIAEFPAEFSISNQPGYAIGIEDDVAAPEAPLLTIKMRSTESRLRTK